MRLIKSAANDIPSHATGLHVFAIKETSDGAQAFIGWYLPNGNFNYSQVPYEPQNTKEKTGTIAQQLKAAIALVRKQALSHLDTDAQKIKCCDFLSTIEQRAAV